MKIFPVLLLLVLIPFGSRALSKIPAAHLRAIVPEYESVQPLLSPYAGDSLKPQDHPKQSSGQRIKHGHRNYLNSIKVLRAGGIVAFGGACLMTLAAIFATGWSFITFLLLFICGLVALVTGGVLIIVGAVFYFIFRKYRQAR